MKIIYSIAFFFTCFFNLNAQAIFEPSAEFFATGRFRTYYGQESDFQVPPTKITYERSIASTTLVDQEYIISYVNCTQQRKSILSNSRLTLDSNVIVNGLVTKRLRMARPSLNAPFVETERDEYYYSNNKTKPDSIITLPAVNNIKLVRTFTYDLANRITTETVFTDSLGRKIFYRRYTKQSNTDGYTVKTLEENFISSKWVKAFEELITWQSAKLIVHKYLSYEYSQTPDTTFFTPKYVGATNRVDTFAQTYKDTTGKIFPEYARFINVSQNAKGYPTKVLYQALNGTTPVYQPYQEWTFTYYPGDTLVRQKTIKEGNGSYSENYEYCGIPTLTPTTELQTLDFKIYPNPTNQVLNIEIPKNTEGRSIEIFNAMGIMVSKTKQLNVDVSTLPTGIYFVQIKTKNRVGVKRFVVNR
jgi:Secretion system C-terminal sorting domain